MELGAHARSESEDVERFVPEGVEQGGQERVGMPLVRDHQATLGDRERVDPRPKHSPVAEPGVQMRLACSRNCERLGIAVLLQHDHMRAHGRGRMLDEGEQVIGVGGRILHGQGLPRAAECLDLAGAPGDPQVQAGSRAPPDGGLDLPGSCPGLAGEPSRPVAVEALAGEILHVLLGEHEPSGRQVLLEMGHRAVPGIANTTGERSTQASATWPAVEPCLGATRPRPVPEGEESLSERSPRDEGKPVAFAALEQAASAAPRG